VTHRPTLRRMPTAVPTPPTGTSDGTAALQDLLAAGDALVLTGAGISTASGIPDYRGPDGRQRADRPMTIERFRSGPDEQRAYWARSHVGWERFRLARPNAAHLAVTELQRAGLLAGVVTQNVDGLHGAAGTEDVHEIHGRLDEVVCLDCGDVTPREALAVRLAAANPGFREEVAADAMAVRPDGDILLHAADVARFRYVACAACGGVLKPGVVMFGETVPRARYGGARTARAGPVPGRPRLVACGRVRVPLRPRRGPAGPAGRPGDARLVPGRGAGDGPDPRAARGGAADGGGAMFWNRPPPRRRPRPVGWENVQGGPSGGDASPSAAAR